VFARWGLPDHIRVDNGYPWGSPSRDLPSELALWLIGLAVAPTWNPPARPTANPKAERSNGLTRQWGEPHACAGFRALARALARVCRVQREEYPAVGGLTRWEAFPGLRAPRRADQRSAERAAWDLARVDALLARGCWLRRASCNGSISLYGHNRAVGRARARRELGVRFDPAARCWMIFSPHGALIKRLRAPELTKARILALAVGRRRP
jgi:hypothetical protein